MAVKNLLPLSNDLTFKTFFKDEGNRPSLISLLSNFLPLPSGSRIVGVEILDPELPPDRVPKGFHTGKKYILDLAVKFERTTEEQKTEIGMVNVEVQTTSRPYMAERMLAYASRLYGG